MTMKEMMQQAFKDEIYYPLKLGYQISFDDIASLCDGDKISVILDFGKADDGKYIIERKKGTLYFYREGHFGRILIFDKGALIASLTEKQFYKIRGISGALLYTKKYQRFFAKN